MMHIVDESDIYLSGSEPGWNKNYEIIRREYTLEKPRTENGGGNQAGLNICHELLGIDEKHRRDIATEFK